MIGKMRAIQCIKETALVCARGSRNIGERFQVEHGSAFAPDLSALIKGRKPAGGPIFDAIHWKSARVTQDNVCRQILPLGAERVNHPGTPCRAAGLEFSAVDNT